MNSKELNSQKIMALAILALKKEMKQIISEEIRKELEVVNKKNVEEVEYLSAKQVCKIFGFSLSTLERHVKKGLSPISKSKGCSRLFKKNDVENFLKK